MKKIVIREEISEYMASLKRWLEETKDASLEEMDAFFTARLDHYEQHMSRWSEAYLKMAELIPDNCGTLLDLGCGTGLELDRIFERFPRINVTGIDMCAPMLAKLKGKHPDKKMALLCEDYFDADFGAGKFDAVISFETLHHFMPESKERLFKKIRAALKEGGMYIECDYIACCDEEESLLLDEYHRRRKQAGNTGKYVHFDIPLTLELETTLLINAGFSHADAVDCIDGATFIVAV